VSDVPVFDPDSGLPIAAPGGLPTTDCTCCDGSGCSECDAFPCDAFNQGCTPCSLRLTSSGISFPNCSDTITDPTTGTTYHSNTTVTAGDFNLCAIHGAVRPGLGLECSWGANDDTFVDQPYAAPPFAVTRCTDAGFPGPVGLTIRFTRVGAQIWATAFCFTTAFGGLPDTATGYAVANANGSYCFLGTKVFNKPQITRADFPFTITNDLATNAPTWLYKTGTVTVDAECCGDCDGCPPIFVDPDTGDENGCDQCCGRLQVSLVNAGCMTGFYDLFQEIGDNLGPLCRWSDSCGEALLRCDISTGLWTLTITDVLGKCGDPGSYIEATFKASFCPELGKHEFTVTHNDFGAGAAIHLGDCATTDVCPSNCSCCCNTYTVTIGSTPSGCLNGTYTLGRPAQGCNWFDSGGSSLSYDVVIGCRAATRFQAGAAAEWYLQVIAHDLRCGVAGTIEWVAPVIRVGDNDLLCPPTHVVTSVVFDPTYPYGWLLSQNDFGGTPTLSVATDDCTVTTAVCPTDCSACCSGYTWTFLCNTFNPEYITTEDGSCRSPQARRRVR
jgi:hypothetical protein